MSNTFPKTAQGPAVPADAAAQALDAHGFTNPNLHRRIDPQQPAPGSEELAPKDYVVGVFGGLNSYRTATIHYHDEESTTSEIP